MQPFCRNFGDRPVFSPFFSVKKWRGQHSLAVGASVTDRFMVKAINKVNGVALSKSVLCVFIIVFQVVECVPSTLDMADQISANSDECPVVESCGNVAFVENVQTVEAKADVAGGDVYPQLCSSEPIYSDPSVLERWVVYKVFNWDTSAAVGSEICAINFMKDLLTDSRFKNYVFSMPFKMYRYFMSDLIIRVTINSTRFHIGTLIGSFYYQASLDDNTYRNNIASLQLLPNILLYAAQTNPGELSIPFKNAMGVVSTRDDKTDYWASLGTFRLTVLNKLWAPAKAGTIVNVSVSFCLKNAKFFGMIGGDIMPLFKNLSSAPFKHLTTQIGVEALIAAEVVAKLINRDSPTVTPTMTPVNIEQINLCHGTAGVRTNVQLRLKPNVIDSLPPGSNITYGASRIDFIKQIFGYLGTFVWMVSDPSGKVLYFYVARTVPYRDQMHSVTLGKGENQFDASILPPVAFLGSLFIYRRGRYRLRFNVVASMFHSGKMLVAFIPGVLDAIPPLEKVLSCYHVIFDIGVQREFFYDIPFIGQNPWMACEANTYRYNDREMHSQGTVVVYVLNKCNYMEDLATSIYVNVYLAGAPDFEVAVPRASSFGLCWNSHYAGDNGNDVVWRMRNSPSDQFILSNTDSIYGGKVCVLDSYEGILSINKDILWQLPKFDVYTPPYSVKDGVRTYHWHVTYVKQDGTEIDIVYFVPNPNNRHVFLGCKDETNANAFISSKGASAYLLTFYKNSIQVADVDEKYQFLVKNGVDPPILGTQMDRAPDPRFDDIGCVENIAGSLPSTNYGEMFFGEPFVDLKDLGRRFGYLCTVLVQEDCVASHAFAGVPVLVQGIAIDDVTDAVANNGREGVTPQITASFRYGRGGIRLYLVFTGFGPRDVLWVQHRPDFTLPKNIVLKKSDLTNCEGYNHSGYATHIVYIATNQSLGVECPFYAHGRSLLLQDNVIESRSDHVGLLQGLGTVLIGTIGKLETTSNDRRVTIYYALADDFEFGAFIGAPPLVEINSFKPGVTSVCPIIDNDGKFSSVGSSFEDVSGPSGLVTQMEVHEEVETQMDFLTGAVGAFSGGCAVYTAYNAAKGAHTAKTTANYLLGAAEDVRTYVGGSVDRIVEMLENILERGEESPDGLFNKMIAALNGLGISLTKEVVNFVSQLCHCVFSPTVPNIILAIGTMFVNLGLTSLSILDSIRSVFFRFLEVCKSLPRQLNIGGGLETQADFEDFAPQFGSVLFLAFCSLTKTVLSPPKSFPDFFKDLISSIKNFAMGANHVMTLFKSLIAATHKFWEWYNVYKDPTVGLIATLHQEQAFVRKWAKAVILLTDPVLFSFIEGRSDHIALVFKLAIIADILAVKLALNEFSVDAVRSLKGLVDRIRDLRERLAFAHRSPAAKCEPYVLQLNGDKKIGKSYLLTQLAVELVDAANIDVPGEVIYYYPPNTDFMNGARNQPVLAIDDAFSMRGDKLESLVTNWFNLKSPAIYNPNMAHLDEKNLHYSPRIMLVASNVAFPALSCCEKPEALFRRRDLLVDVRLKKQFVGADIAREVEVDVLRRFGHLEFAFYSDVCDENSLNKRYVNYDEFLRIVKADFMRFEDRELSNYYNRLEILSRVTRNIDPTDGLYNNYYKVVQDVSELLQEIDSDNSFLRYMGNIGSSGDFNAGLAEQARDQILDMALLDDLPPLETQADFQISGGDFNNRPGWMRVDGNKIVSVEVTEFLANLHTKTRKRGTELRAFLRANNVRPFDLVGTAVQRTGDLMAASPSLCEHSRLSSRFAFRFGKFSFIDVGSNEIVLHDIDHSEFDCVDCCMKSVDSLFFWFVYAAKNYQDICHYIATPTNRICVPMMIRLLCHNADFREFFNFVPISYQPRRVAEAEEAVDSIFSVDFMSMIKEKLYQFYEWIWSTLDYWRVIAGLFAVAGAGYALYQRFRSDPSCENVQFSSNSTQYRPSGDHQTRTVGKADIPVIIRSLQGELGTQSAYTSFSNKLDIIRRNTFELLFCERATGVVQNVRCLALASTYAICLSHYVSFFRATTNRSNYDVFIRQFNGPRVHLDESDLVFHGEDSTDIWVVRINPVKVPAFRSLYGHIATFADHARVGSSALLVVNNASGTTSSSVSIRRITGATASVTGVPGKHVSFHSCYEYAMGGPGICGSVLLDPSLERCIIGVHVAGTGINYGISELIYREMFEQVVPLFRDKCQRASRVPGKVDDGFGRDKNSLRNVLDPNSVNDTSGYDPDFVDVEVIDAVQPGPLCGPVDTQQFVRVFPSLGEYEGCSISGQLLPEYSVHMPNTSIIRRSGVVGNEFHVPGPYTEPSILSANDTRYRGSATPLYDGVRYKMAIPLGQFEVGVLDKVFEFMSSELRAYARPVRTKVGVLSMKEAFSGFPGLVEYKHIELSTSPGFPFILMKPDKSPGKHSFFRYDETANGYVLKGLHRNLLDVLLLKDKQRRSLIVPFSPYLCCLKDECLPSEKVSRIGSTRVIDACAVDLVLVLRQYFLDFVASFMANRHRLHHAVGVNEMSLEWGHYYSKLASVGGPILCGDYKKFGPTLRRECVFLAFRLMIDWYEYNGATAAETRYRKVLMFENCNAFYVVKSFVLQFYCGSPSGSPLTTIINTLCNNMYYLSAIFVLLAKHVHRPRFFVDEMLWFTYGDDIVSAICAHLSAEFNNRLLAEYFLKLGIVYTDIQKDGEIRESCSLEDAVFLKRRWVPMLENGMVVVMAPLDLKSVFSMIHWAKKRRPLTNEEQYQLSVAFLEMIFDYGREEYDGWRVRLIHRWNYFGFSFHYKTYDEVFDNRYIHPE